jgi:hypothetical protein
MTPGGTHGLVLTTLPHFAGRELLRTELWWSFCIAVYAEADDMGRTDMGRAGVMSLAVDV